MGGTGDSDSLLEREEGTAAIAELLAHARVGEGGALLIEGPAGIGKSRLVDTACRATRDAGMTLCMARGGDLEQDFAFGVVRQLYEPLLAGAERAERGRLLAGAAVAAGPVVGFAPEAPEPAPEAATQQPPLHTCRSRRLGRPGRNRRGRRAVGRPPLACSPRLPGTARRRTARRPRNRHATTARVDGVRETVDCGKGRDYVKADKKDKVKHCERVKAQPEVR